MNWVLNHIVYGTQIPTASLSPGMSPSMNLRSHCVTRSTLDSTTTIISLMKTMTTCPLRPRFLLPQSLPLLLFLILLTQLPLSLLLFHLLLLHLHHHDPPARHVSLSGMETPCLTLRSRVVGLLMMPTTPPTLRPWLALTLFTGVLPWKSSSTPWSPTVSVD